MPTNTSTTPLLNRITQGDCLELMKQLEPGSVDMILCYLSYGTTECKWDSCLPLPSLWRAYTSVLKPSGSIVLTACQPFTTILIHSNLGLFKYCWIWVKSNCSGFANAKRQPLRSYEDVAIFYVRQPIYNPQGITKLTSPKIRTKETGEFMGRTGFKDGYAQQFTNYPKNVVTIASERSTVHPTQKPVALFEYLILTYTNPGDIVLDNCIGSGTTAIACLNTNRNFIGFELSEEYVQIANQRLNEWSPK